MAVWINQPENTIEGGGAGTLFLLIDDTFFLNIGNGYKLIIEEGSEAGPTIWTNQPES